MAQSAVDQLLLATTNAGKIAEIQSILQSKQLEISLQSLANLAHPLESPEETGQTFAENAELKARYYGVVSHLPTIADDSGLSVLSLDGFPGINSARWVTGTDTDRITALLKLLEERGLTEPIRRRAYFSCVAALYDPATDRTQLFEGTCWGTLAHVPIGSSGFGYDPIFIPDGYDQTMAQLGSAVKNQISHRAKAFTELAEYLKHFV